MAHINLLKGRQRDVQHVHRRSGLELLAGIIMLTAVCSLWGWVAVDGGRDVRRFEQDIQATQQRLVLMQAHRKRVLALREQRDAMVAEHRHLDALSKDPGRSVRLLSVISQVVDPLDVWLVGMQAKEATITLSGLARSHESVVSFAKDLEQTDMLGPVNVFEVHPHATRTALFRFSMDVPMEPAEHG